LKPSVIKHALNWEIIDSSDFAEIDPFFQTADLHHNYDIITEMAIANEINASDFPELSQYERNSDDFVEAFKLLVAKTVLISCRRRQLDFIREGFQLWKIEGWQTLKIKADDIIKYRTRKVKTVTELLEELDPAWMAEHTSLEGDPDINDIESVNSMKYRAWNMLKSSLEALALNNDADSTGRRTSGVEKLQSFLKFITGSDIIPLHPDKWKIEWAFDPNKEPKAQACFAILQICAERYCRDHGPGNLSFQALMDADISYIAQEEAITRQSFSAV
jgi:hypothetical protein